MVVSVKVLFLGQRDLFDRISKILNYSIEQKSKKKKMNHF